MQFIRYSIVSMLFLALVTPTYPMASRLASGIVPRLIAMVGASGVAHAAAQLAAPALDQAPVKALMQEGKQRAAETFFKAKYSAIKYVYRPEIEQCKQLLAKALPLAAIGGLLYFAYRLFKYQQNNVPTAASHGDLS